MSEKFYSFNNMPKKAVKKVLFVSHKANMSGAPLLLLDIVREFKKQSAVPFQVLMMEDGNLANEFRLLGETLIWQKNSQHISVVEQSLLKKLKYRVNTITRGAEILFRLRGTSLIFFNTISNGHILKKLLFLKAKHICYVHELEAAIHMTTNKESLQAVLQNTNLFIACSQAVKNNLSERHAVPEKNIRVLPAPLATVYRNKKDYTAFVQVFKDGNAIPAGAIVVGVVGGDEWRKGYDLFLPLISLYTNLYPASNVFFVWKGCNHRSFNSFFNLYDVEKFSQPNCLLLPHGNDSIDTMASFDIHLLISREDPYPLVVLEAASFGIPTVSFCGAGGSTEFIETDAGISVPYGNLLSMVAALQMLITKTEVRNRMGKCAQEKLQVKHARKIAMPAFVSTIEQFNSPEKSIHEISGGHLPVLSNLM
ncbi:glycosyltransferase [Ferruginibacter paludis]|uniref:glycosyltransferase n=1 Tax=Ferruginibacter paludis TaxID=1310417 RepID=UPI0025B54644|nr:glycosyltransferase [Ferruginibacter paludis]MDN3656730.1 glycosyltransferase [Ferruginibacter paludis]